MRGRESMIFEIEGILPQQGKQWQLGQDQVAMYRSNGNLFIRDGKIIIKMRPEDEKIELTEPFWGLLNKEIGTAESAKKELSFVLGNDKHGFETVKPTSLIKRLIFHSTNSSDLILDFFAGSGTTGDAVMQLNAEDKANGKEGKRKYILVQLPEKIDAKKNKTAFDFVKNELGVAEPTIFEITRERLVRASKKINDKSGFKIFETMSIWEGYDFEAKEFEKNLQLFDESKLTQEDLEALLTTWKTYDGIALTQELEKIDLGGYVGHYFGSKLYLTAKNFQTKHLKKLLEELDENNKFSPASIIVFGYHFDSKNLREISENVASYANKKKLEIDFVTRY